MLALFAFYPLISQAQESAEPEEEEAVDLDALPEFEEGEEANIQESEDSRNLIATVNILNSKIVSQENNKITLSFLLSNRSKVQPGIKYAVNLTKNGEKGAQILIDEKVYSEIISLSENFATTREVVYEAPEYLSGIYNIWIISQNEKGLPLSSSSLGKITLKGNNEYVEIQKSSCDLQVQGETGEKRSGKSINSNENLLISCNIINHFKTEQTTNPVLAVYSYSTFGEKVEEKKQSTITLNPSESKLVSFTVPKVNKPQNYNIVLSFANNENKIVSNQASFYFVLNGARAVIQNLRMDQDYYAKDDVAGISLFYYSYSTNAEKVSLELNINSENKACADSIKQELEKIGPVDLEAKITKDCLNPEVSVVLKDKDGNVLDQSILKITSLSDVPEVSEEEKTAAQTGSKKSIIVILAIVLLALLAILIVIIQKRKGSAMISLLIFAVVGIGMIFGEAKEARGDTFTLYPNLMPSCSDSVPVVIQIVPNYFSGSAFVPGQDIMISALVQPKGDYVFIQHVEGTYNDWLQEFFLDSPLEAYTTYENTKNWGPAPVQEGLHPIKFFLQAQDSVPDYLPNRCVSDDIDNQNVYFNVENIPSPTCYNCPSVLAKDNNGSFTLRTSDLLSRKIRFEVDWDADGDVDEVGTSDNSNDEYVFQHSWNSTGSKTFRSRAKIEGYHPTSGESYNYTPWSSHSVTINENHAPSAPTITGLTSGNTGTTYNFGVVSTDSDGDTITYIVDWTGTGSGTSDSNYTASGTKQTKSHSWSSAGTYTFRVQAKDSKGATSSWASYTITISGIVVVVPGNNKPYTPTITGPTTGKTGTSYNFDLSTSGDPDMDEVRFCVDLNNSGDCVPQGNFSRDYTLRITNSWSVAGYYYINVRVEDEHGAFSNWASLSILIEGASTGSSKCLTRPDHCSKCNNNKPTSPKAWTTRGSCPHTTTKACLCECRGDYEPNRDKTQCVRCEGSCPISGQVKYCSHTALKATESYRFASSCPSSTSHCYCACQDGYELNAEGTECVLKSYSCLNLPVGCNYCDQNLKPTTGDKNAAVVGNCSNPEACDCACGPGYNREGNTCVPVKDGECGDAAGNSFCKAPSRDKLCDVGNPSGLALTKTTWSWNCIGSGGGITAGCSATKDCSWTEVNP